MKPDREKKFLEKQVFENPVDERITEVLAVRQKSGTLSCAEAFDVALDLDVKTIEVGRAMDLMKIKINKCRLGLFGHGGGKRVNSDTFPQASLLEALSPFREASRMPCSRAYEIALELGIGRPAVANACEALGIKIKPCQLGAF